MGSASHDDQVSARGTGSAAAAADYLTREGSPEPPEQDPEKNPDEVTVLRGNPDQVAAVAMGWSSSTSTRRA